MWENCKDIQDYIVTLRRDLHQIPELAKELPKTQEYIAKELDRLGISYKKTKMTVVSLVRLKAVIQEKPFSSVQILMLCRFRKIQELHTVPNMTDICMLADMMHMLRCFSAHFAFCKKIGKI